MNLLVIILLSINTFILALPVKEESFEKNITTFKDDIDGWSVPQVDGTFKWMTKKEAARAERQLSMARWGRKLKVQFNLFTKENRTKPEELLIGKETLSLLHFNASNPTRFIIHGWQNDGTSDVNVVVRDALLDVMDCNVITVDWHQISKNFNYIYAKNNVPKVGKKVAEMIDFLVTEGNMSLDDLHVIGHSLGAHVAGFAGKHLTTGKIHTIMGLDPAWPLYPINGCKKRLCIGDAIYVEVIHTNGGACGFLEPIGNVDFYVSGGISQPGCDIGFLGFYRTLCSHLRAFEYFAEAIRENNFDSVKCSYSSIKSCKEDDFESIAKLGNSINFESLNGTYYTPVNSEAPYGKGKTQKLN